MKKQETDKAAKPVQKGTAASGKALRELLTDGIRDLYWAENHLVKALAKMISAASAPELVTALTQHLGQTEGQVSRLEKIFALLDEKAVAKKCDAMEGLTKEGEGLVEQTKAGTAVRDVGIILASQKVEHYEIAAYTGLFRLASTLGLNDVADLLEQNLAEEQQTDSILADIAMNAINQSAANE